MCVIFELVTLALYSALLYTITSYILRFMNTNDAEICSDADTDSDEDSSDDESDDLEKFASGITPLHMAAIFGHCPLIEFLVNEGESLTAIDGRGFTPLHWAAYKGNLDAVKYLSKDGVALHIKDKDGKTPLDYAAHMEHLDVTAALILNDPCYKQ